MAPAVPGQSLDFSVSPSVLPGVLLAASLRMHYAFRQKIVYHSVNFHEFL